MRRRKHCPSPTATRHPAPGSKQGDFPACRLGIAQALVTGLITVLVANVPEGLPATVTTQLTVSADRMRKQNVLVKRMDMIEVGGCACV